MKLLLDQNLSRGLLADLRPRFPDSTHVARVHLDQASAMRVWEYAASSGYAILSKDTDFLYLSAVRGHPPKVIQLNIGNSSTAEVRELLRLSVEEIISFGKDPIESFLILKKK